LSEYQVGVDGLLAGTMNLTLTKYKHGFCYCSRR
jgi:hypothetical protein